MPLYLYFNIRNYIVFLPKHHVKLTLNQITKQQITVCFKIFSFGSKTPFKVGPFNIYNVCIVAFNF